MHDLFSIVCEVLLTGLIVYNLVSSFLSSDKSKIWSPLSIISLTYIYYVLIPFWGGTIEKYAIDESLFNGNLFHSAALISYVFILLGFSSSGKTSFRKWNTLISNENVGLYGFLVFLVGYFCYSSVRGFHFTIAADMNETNELATGGFIYYFVMMMDMLPFASALLLIRVKGRGRKLLFLLVILFIFMQFLFGGARWRIVVGLLALLTSYYLYPKVKRVNVIFLLCLAFLVFWGFSVMDQSRIRGKGIDMQKASELKFSDIKRGADENYSVYWFSLLCMDKIHETGERVYFQPIVSSLCMPIPRFLFPKKPGAEYIHSIEERVHAGGGAAFLNFVESYYSFGWLGIILWAWFLGWLSRKYWDNYKNNRDSIGSIVALGVYNGFCYVAISRGYLPATVTTFILAICIPFWLISFLKWAIER